MGLHSCKYLLLSQPKYFRPSTVIYSPVSIFHNCDEYEQNAFERSSRFINEAIDTTTNVLYYEREFLVTDPLARLHISSEGSWPNRTRSVDIYIIKALDCGSNQQHNDQFTSTCCEHLN
jgi:hypothetical protein